jgi:hypothetical protein
MIGKYNILLLIIGIFLIFYKLIELGFTIADSKKISGCSNNDSISTWMYVSSIFGIVSCLFFGFKGLNSYLMVIHTCSDIYTSMEDYEFLDVNDMGLTKIVTVIMFVSQIIITALGTHYCLKMCQTISPYRINELIKMSVIVNYVQLVTMIAVIKYHSFVKQTINNVHAVRNRKDICWF